MPYTMDYSDQARFGMNEPDDAEEFGPCHHCGEQAVMSVYPLGAEDEIEVCRNCYETLYQNDDRPQEPTADDVPF